MHYLADIKGVRETEEGTELIIRIPKEFIKFDILHKKIGQAEVRLDDGRTITAEQRKKVYATIKDIAWYMGDFPEEVKEFLKFEFCGETGEKYFSLSNCTMDIAREFITFLIDFVLRNNIALSDLGLNRTDDISKYLYGCIKYRRCCITGKHAAIHHVEGSRVGMGNNRRKVSHKDRELMALCAEWHDRVHKEGEEEIFKAYKIYGIKVDVETLRELGITEEDIN